MSTFTPATIVSATLPAFVATERAKRNQSATQRRSDVSSTYHYRNVVNTGIYFGIVACIPAIGDDATLYRFIREHFAKLIAHAYAKDSLSKGIHPDTIRESVEHFASHESGVVWDWFVTELGVAMSVLSGIASENNVNPLHRYRVSIERAVKYAVGKGGITLMRGVNNTNGNRTNKRENRFTSRERTFGVANRPIGVRKASDERSGIEREFESMSGADIDDILQSVRVDCLGYLADPRSLGVLPMNMVVKFANRAVFNRAKQLRELCDYHESKDERKARTERERNSFGSHAGLGSAYVELSRDGYTYVVTLDEVVSHLFGDTRLGDAVRDVVYAGVQFRRTDAKWDGLTSRPPGMSDKQWKRECDRYHKFVSKCRRIGEVLDIPYTRIAKKHGLHPEQLHRAVTKLRVKCRMCDPNELETLDEQWHHETWQEYVAKNPTAA